MRRFPKSLLLGLAFVFASLPGVADEIASLTKDVGGVKLHYLSAGHGPTVILLHGYAETSRMWRPLIPKLADRFTVIAPDLPGIGDSDIPAQGLDMKSAATTIHALAKALGVTKARVVGHDIGLMVAYAYAAAYRQDVLKLALMDAFLPGVAGWEAIYNSPAIWHFRFYGPTPEALAAGRERLYLDSLWDGFAADPRHSLCEEDRVGYTLAYAGPGRMAAGFEYFRSFPKTAAEFAEFARTKLTIPVLSIGGDKSLGEALGAQAKVVSTDATVIIVKGAGHWLIEESPDETLAALDRFL
jgi:pimeloyl-ACP methyl ester carboxylesterase